jgi:hypothetical protein
MKKYRVMYRPAEQNEIHQTRTEEVDADGWRVDPDTDAVLLYQQVGAQQVRVFDVPKTRFMRINEIPG